MYLVEHPLNHAIRPTRVSAQAFFIRLVENFTDKKLLKDWLPRIRLKFKFTKISYNG